MSDPSTPRPADPEAGRRLPPATPSEPATPIARSAPSIRVLVEPDLGFAHELSRLAGWNQTRRDWERFLALAPEGCFLAECEGEPAGTATTTAYGGGLAWIGMVLVHPDFRRRGLGTALLRRAIDHLRLERGIACVRLDATPEGRPLYEGLGFRAEWSLSRWRRPALASEGAGDVEAGGSPHPARMPEPPSAPDEAGLALDREVFGADRGELLRSLARGSIHGATEGDGSFGYVREGQRALYLGPVTAAAETAGLELVRDLVARCPGDRELFWDLPDGNRAAARLAGTLGFEPVRTLTRMWLGEGPLEADPSRIFGLAEPGLG